MMFYIEIDEVSNKRRFHSKFRFKITLWQFLKSLFKEEKIKNFTLEIGETRVFAETLKQFLIEREIEENENQKHIDETS